MSNNPPLPDRAVQQQLNISHSSTGTLTGCARRFEFYKFYDHPPRVQTLASSAGTALHIGYQDYLIHGDKDQATWQLMKHFPVKYNWDASDDRSLEACIATLDMMIAAAVTAEFEVAHIKTRHGVLMPAIEVPFEIVFSNVILPNGMGVSYVGWMDAILYSSFLDRYRVSDIKTHRDRKQDRTSEYKFAGQLVPYGMVLQHILQKSLTQFDVMYIDTFIDILEPRVAEYTFSKGQAAIEDWLLTLLLDIQKLKTYIELDHFPRTRHGCRFFNSPCQFIDFCESRDRAKLQRIFLLNADPEPPTAWDPWVKFEIELPEAA